MFHQPIEEATSVEERRKLLQALVHIVTICLKLKGKNMNNQSEIKLELLKKGEDA